MSTPEYCKDTGVIEPEGAMVPSRFEQMSVAQLVERLDDEEAQARQEVVAWREKIAEAEERLEQLAAVRRTLARLQAKDEVLGRNPVEDLRAEDAARDGCDPVDVLDHHARGSHEPATDEADRQDPAESPHLQLVPPAGAFGGVASGWPSLTGVNRQVVIMLASAGRAMRAREVALALGEPDVHKRVEVVRTRLKRLIDKGWLVEHQRGQFSIAEGLNGATLNGGAADH
ncbi:hypothetical protein [Nonomuraea typhae]|uniref:MarR family transcriptional regulator n=1 Tax=Nonomuraea typhae TaxID=2603600 RepID=A0ABW7YYM1_9ACTN